MYLMHQEKESGDDAGWRWLTPAEADQR